MSPARLAACILILHTAGCATSVDTPSTTPTTRAATSDGISSAATQRSATDSSSPGRKAPPASASNPTAPRLRLDPVKVQEWAFTDFGMSVKTNFEVTIGENVQWMEISALAPGSSAVQARLLVGDRILAIGGTLIGKFDRASLLEALFQRKKGDQLRLLVASPRDALPRFVTLTAGRP